MIPGDRFDDRSDFVTVVSLGAFLLSAADAARGESAPPFTYAVAARDLAIAALLAVVPEAEGFPAGLACVPGVHRAKTPEERDAEDAAIRADRLERTKFEWRVSGAIQDATRAMRAEGLDPNDPALSETVRERAGLSVEEWERYTDA